MVISFSTVRPEPEQLRREDRATSFAARSLATDFLDNS